MVKQAENVMSKGKGQQDRVFGEPWANLSLKGFNKYEGENLVYVQKTKLWKALETANMFTGSSAYSETLLTFLSRGEARYALSSKKIARGRRDIGFRSSLMYRELIDGKQIICRYYLVSDSFFFFDTKINNNKLLKYKEILKS